MFLELGGTKTRSLHDTIILESKVPTSSFDEDKVILLITGIFMDSMSALFHPIVEHSTRPGIDLIQIPLSIIYLTLKLQKCFFIVPWYHSTFSGGFQTLQPLGTLEPGWMVTVFQY